MNKAKATPKGVAFVLFCVKICFTPQEKLLILLTELEIFDIIYLRHKQIPNVLHISVYFFYEKIHALFNMLV